MATARTPFLVSATVDFPDDCRYVAFDEGLLGQLIDRLRWAGIQRLYWNYYQPGMWKMFGDTAPATRETQGRLGAPLSLGCRLAHERGMQFYAVIKPYETGTSHVTPIRSPETANRPGLPRIGGVITGMDPWVMARPELRVRGRAGDMPAGLKDIPVVRIQLRQKDMAPIRIKGDRVEIWTSSDNYGYQKRDVTFTLSEGTDVAPHDVFDGHGHLVTHAGDRIHLLDLTGLNLLDPFIAVTTNFDDDAGSFHNTVNEMVRAFGPGDQPIPIVTACHKAVWTRSRDFRLGDLEYDVGHAFNVCLDVTNQRPVCPHCRQSGVTDCMHMRIYPDMVLCHDGVIAFARGRNEYLPASLCETYPEVRSYWLDWIGECVAAGVDGVDIRISNHACWTETPDLYGFNEPVLAEYERRHGVNPDVEPYDLQLLGALRGEFYNQFLRAAKRRLSAAGKRLQAYIEVESFEPGGPMARRVTRPGNIIFDWRGWLRSGLLDEATLMAAVWDLERVFTDPRSQQIMDESHAQSIPLHLRHYMWTSREGEYHANQLERTYRQGRLSGYNLYETASMYDTRCLGPDGQLQFYPGMLEALHDRIEQLDLM